MGNGSNDATARIAMPASMVRLSSGRIEMSEVEQACDFRPVLLIFAGELQTLLVTPNPGLNDDIQMLHTLGLRPMSKE